MMRLEIVFLAPQRMADVSNSCEFHSGKQTAQGYIKSIHQKFVPSFKRSQALGTFKEKYVYSPFYRREQRYAIKPMSCPEQFKYTIMDTIKLSRFTNKNNELESA